jgi:predicted nucleotidyltransferase
MDFRKIKSIALEYRKALVRKNIYPDAIILFGSYAKGKPHKHSDIDIAVVSKKFGKNRLKELQKLNLIAFNVDARIEAIPINLFEYMKEETTSPILDQIFKTGIVLF